MTGLTTEEKALVQHLEQKIRNHSSRNKKKRQYVEAKYILQQLGVAVPPTFQNIYSLLGWCGIAVDALSNRINFEGIVAAGDSNPYGLADDFTDNDMELESSLAIKSALKYGCSFITVTGGDTGQGEPEVLINNRSALTTSIIWDQRKRRATAGLTILSTDDNTNQMNSFVLYQDEYVLEAVKDGNKWLVLRTSNPTKRAPITVLRYKPDADEDRPLGRSVVSRPMRGLVDHGARTMLRSEISGEFYSWPQKWALNTSEDDFVSENGEPIPSLAMAMSAFLSFPAPEKDEVTGETGPEVKVGQFQAASQEPHSKELEMVAAQFAAHAHLPVSQLGVVQSQPESSEAMETANQALIQDAENAFVSMGSGLRDVAKLTYMVKNSTSDLPDDMRRISARFRNASQPTQAASADAAVKLVQSGILPADSDVTLERVGLSSTDIERIKADRQRAQAAQRLEQILAVGARSDDDMFKEGEANGDTGTDQSVSAGSGEPEPGLSLTAK